MIQPSLLPNPDCVGIALQRNLVNALRLGTWRKREDLARQLGVSVRAIRDAASTSHGEIVSGQNGLKLTVCCTESELQDALSRMASQIHQMSTRVVATQQAWDCRTEDRKMSA